MTYIHCLSLTIHSIKLYHSIKLTFPYYSLQYIQLPSTYWLWEQFLMTFVFLNISPEHGVPRINNYRQSGLPRAGSRRRGPHADAVSTLSKSQPHQVTCQMRVSMHTEFYDSNGTHAAVMCESFITQREPNCSTHWHSPAQAHPRFRHQLQVGGPPTTVMVDSSLEELVELTESGYTHSYSLLQEQIQI